MYFYHCCSCHWFAKKLSYMNPIQTNISCVSRTFTNIGSCLNQITTLIHAHSSDEKFTSEIPIVITYSTSNMSHMWLLDSGANDHICFSLHFFESFYKIWPIQVHFPNGNSVVVNYASNVHLSPKLYITKVLYSPQFTLNLISFTNYVNLYPVQFNSHMMYAIFRILSIWRWLVWLNR